MGKDRIEGGWLKGNNIHLDRVSYASLPHKEWQHFTTVHCILYRELEKDQGSRSVIEHSSTMREAVGSSPESQKRRNKK